MIDSGSASDRTTVVDAVVVERAEDDLDARRAASSSLRATGTLDRARRGVHLHDVTGRRRRGGRGRSGCRSGGRARDEGRERGRTLRRRRRGRRGAATTLSAQRVGVVVAATSTPRPAATSAERRAGAARAVVDGVTRRRRPSQLREADRVGRANAREGHGVERAARDALLRRARRRPRRRSRSLRTDSAG